MKKVLTILILIFSIALTHSQVNEVEGKLKVTNVPDSAITDSLVTVNTNGLIQKANLRLVDVADKLWVSNQNYSIGSHTVNTDNQTLSITDKTLSINSGNSVNMPFVENSNLAPLYGSIPIGAHVIPVDFPNPLGASVSYDGEEFIIDKGVVDIDFTVANTHTKYYVNYQTGSDSNDGLTSASAVKTYGKAADLAQAVVGADEIILEDEWIGYQSIINAGEFYNHDIKITSASPSGYTRITQKRESYEGTFAWVDNSDGTFSSTTNQADHSAMYDNKFKDKYGIATPMKAVNSVSEVIALKGSFYYDGTTMTMQMIDSREPDGDWIYASSLTTVLFAVYQTKADATVILENLITYSNNKTVSSNNGFGGRNQNYSGANPNTSKLGVLNCRGVGASGNGFGFTDYRTSIYQNSVAKYNTKDGFNYHSIAGNPNGKYMTVYEINCISDYNGYTGFKNQSASTGSNNGSTAHDNMNIIRVNSKHTNVEGSVIADVNGVYSLNFGINAEYPNKNVELYNAAYWYANDGYGDLPSGMYLIGCSGSNSTKGSADAVTFLKTGTGSDITVSSWQGGKQIVIDGGVKDVSNNAYATSVFENFYGSWFGKTVDDFNNKYDSSNFGKTEIDALSINYNSLSNIPDLADMRINYDSVSTGDLTDENSGYSYSDFGTGVTRNVPIGLTAYKWIIATGGQEITLNPETGVTVVIIKNTSTDDLVIGSGSGAVSATLIRTGVDTFHLIK